MPQCIFCKTPVPHKFSDKPDASSMCLDCLVEFRRFELQNSEEVIQRVFPERVVQALRRMKNTDPQQLEEPEKKEQFQKDFKTVQEIIPL